MKIKTSLVCALLGAQLAPPALADTLSVLVGVSRWQSEYSGQVRDGATLIDINNDLQLDEEDTNIFRVAFEHPVPLVPNIEIAHSALDISGSGVLTRNIEFNGVEFSVDTEVQTEADLTHTDIKLYYELLDNWVSFDLGAAVRLFDGDVEINSTGLTAREDLEEPVPMIYAKAQFDLPFTGFAISADASGIGYDGDSIIDYSLRLIYQSELGLGAELGYRSMELELDEISDFTTNLEVSGPFASLTFKF